MKKAINSQLWVIKETEGYRIGLTNQAQDDLGGISFVTLPKVGEVLEKDAAFAEVEAEKSVSEFTLPFAGTVLESNQAAVKNPEILDDPTEEKAWLIRLSDVSETDFLNLG